MVQNAIRANVRQTAGLVKNAIRAMVRQTAGFGTKCNKSKRKTNSQNKYSWFGTTRLMYYIARHWKSKWCNKSKRKTKSQNKLGHFP